MLKCCVNFAHFKQVVDSYMSHYIAFNNMA
jgi:hypothetical protein